MIDLGLTKIAVIGVVALVVIGPEKLPQVARMIGALYGRAQRYLSQVKAEVSRELDVETLRNLHQDVLDGANSVKSEFTALNSGVSHTQPAHLAEGETASAWQGDRGLFEAPVPGTQEDIARKARAFRRQKLMCTSSVPAWYKNRHGKRQHVLSGAARVKTSRPAVTSTTSFF